MKQKKLVPAKFLRNCLVEDSTDGDTGECQLVIALGTEDSKRAAQRKGLLVDFVNRALKAKEMKTWLKNQYGRRLI